MIAEQTTEGLIVRFSKEPHLDPIATEEKGAPVYKDRDYITIKFVGDAKREIRRPVHLKPVRGYAPDPARFPVEWAAYQAGGAQGAGIPLDVLGMQKNLIRAYATANVETVEQLAAVTDGNLPALGMGSREMREKARALLKIRGNDTRNIADRLTEQANEIETLKRQVAALSGGPKLVTTNGAQ